MYDIILKGGAIFNGIDIDGKVGDLAILDGKIAAISEHIKTKAKKTVECQGMFVTPGFVDIQNHSDSYWQLLENPGMDSMLEQGYTSIIVGNCGVSLSPLPSRLGLLPIQKNHTEIANNLNWSSFAEFTETIQSQNLGCNVASFVGLSTLWYGLVGEIKPLSSAEEQILTKIFETSLKEGALGLSLGGEETHEWIIMETVMPKLLEILKNNNKVLSVHLRNYSSEILNAVEEIVDLAQKYSVPIKISHLKIEGSNNWALGEELLKKIERASQNGSVGFDVYPFETVYKPLTQYLPNWISKDWKIEIQNKNTWTKVSRWIEDTHENLGSITIAQTQIPINVVNKTINTLARNSQKKLGETVLEILLHGGETMIFDKSLQKEQVEKFALHPLAAIATNGAGFKKEQIKNPLKENLLHPRSFYSTEIFLSMARKNKSITFGEAVRKLTSLPADLVGLKGLGRLTVGLKANIAILENIQEKNISTKHSSVVHTIVNGQIATEDRKLTDNKAGVFIKK